MKRVILISILACLFVASFGQLSQSSTKEYYMTKAKNQRTAAKVLLIGGGALMATSIIILAPGRTSFDNIPGVIAIGGVGVAAAICSFPLFTAAVRNKYKGMAATANIKLEKNSFIYSRSQTVSNVYPALSLTIDL